MLLAVTISDGSFEVPVLAAKAYQYAPDGSAWLFSGGAGVSSNSSAFTSGNASAPAGSQVAFIQCDGSMTQSVYMDGGAYSLSLQAAQRASQTYSQKIQVLVDGVQVGTITPNSTSYGAYRTSTFSVVAGTHTVRFVGLNPQGGDNTAFMDKVTIAATTSISDGGFELPALATKAYQYGADGSPWKFVGGAGVSSNNSAFTSGNSTAPAGSQVAFIQCSGSMSQSVYLDAGAYSLSLQAAQRASQKYSQKIQVLVDGIQVGTITPNSTSYAAYQTSTFSVAAGMHTVRFVGLNPQGGDNTAFVDKVTIAATTSIIDGGFETPALASKAYQYGTDGSAWKFGGGTGLSANSSAFTSSNSGAPAGSQVAFIQTEGSMSQTVYLAAGAYSVSMQAAQRASQKYYQKIQVLVDGAQVGTITPSSTSYAAYQTSAFTVAAGMHTIRFVGLNPQGGDNTAFIDKVTIATAISISGSSFETPVLATKVFQYAPSGSSWQFSGAAGVSSNGSGFTSGNANAPAGSQVAFIQCGGSMSHAVYFNAGTYNLSLQAAQRASQKYSQKIQVLVDGVQVGTITPNSTSYGKYQTANFALTAGAHTIQLVGLNPRGGDNTAFVDDVTVTTATSVSDGSFELPGLAAKAYQYTPDGAPWQFVGGAGLSSNSSAFTSGNAAAPTGSQVAFIQCDGSMSQSVYLAAGTFTVSLQAAQRASQKYSQKIQVLVDGVLVGTITPSSTSYATYKTSTFTVAAGMHTVRFVGLNPQGGDNTAFIDDVQIS